MTDLFKPDYVLSLVRREGPSVTRAITIGAHDLEGLQLVAVSLSKLRMSDNMPEYPHVEIAGYGGEGKRYGLHLMFRYENGVERDKRDEIRVAKKSPWQR